MIGRVLNQRYRIEAEIGQGGMGKVYRGFDTLLVRTVAIKVLSRVELGTEGWNRLLSEAQMAAKLNHPNIVTVYDLDEEDGTPFIVMEYVEGKSLHEDRPEVLEETLKFMRQVCAGLEHAHSHGIIHRDLKPENVVIARDGTAKLMDFGLARSVASRYTSEGMVAGTVFYLAPEQALGQDIDQRTDLYSLGVMLYELTTGELPFVADDAIAVISQHLHAPVVPPQAKNDEISPLLDGLIVRLLSKQPQDRPASAREVREALESAEILDVGAVSVREYSVLERIVRGRMVGRGKELQEARDLWHKTIKGEGQLLLISGEPGIGKTRLAREIVTEAEVSGGQAFVGASYAEGSAPYGAFRQIIREAISKGDLELASNTLAELLNLAPELRHHFPDLPDREPTDPQDERENLLESMVILCASLCDHAPLMLVLEDAHWADSGTLSMLRHLSRNTHHQQVMIIATYREVELDQVRPFHEVLLDMDRERLSKRIKLNHLNPDQTRSMLAILLSGGITPEFLDGIYRETEGNPFFIEEVCKALVDRGKLHFENGQWHCPSISELGIPQSVRVAIQSRVIRLPEEHQEALQLAAILGREFNFETLTRASDLPEDVLIDALDGAERSLLIEEKKANGREIYAFAHALIPATLIEDLRLLKRRKLHRHAAAAIEDLYPDDFEALAYHNVQSGQLEKGVKFLINAGDRARRLYAHQEAIDNYEQAITILEEADQPEETARILMKLGLTYHNAFEFEKSRGAYEKAFINWQQAGISSDRLPPAPHALRVAYREPPTLDPGRCIDIHSALIIYQLFSGLVELNPDMSVVPDVARNWEVLEGGRKYIFHLHNDVYWSDGIPVTAGDFEYAWRRVLDPSSNLYSASLFSDIKGAKEFHQGRLCNPDHVGVHAINDLTLLVELEAPTSYFLQLLTCLASFPVPQHVLEGKELTRTDLGHLVTNGPFRLVEWKENNSALFERNPTYHGLYKGNLERVELSFSARPKENLVQLYENENFDFIDLVDLHPLEADRARQSHAGEFVSGPLLNCYYVGFNVRHPPLNDIRVRQALTLATSRERFASIIFRGQIFPATGGLVPPGMPGYSPNTAIPYDPDKARFLMSEAGYPDGKGFQDMKCLAPDSPFKRTAADFLREQWLENLGVDINWEFAEWGKFLDLVFLNKQNMWIMGYSFDYPDPDYIFRSDDHNHLTGWQNESYNKLVEEAVRVFDQEARMKLYQHADRIVAEEAPILPLAYGRFHMLVKPWVKKINFSAITPPFWKDIIIEPH
jgi:ABC-type oligopeptide transport system substrate-binding subunit/predicted Ser/Thr protein kinase